MDGACCGRDVVVTCCVPLHKQLLQHIWLKCFAGGGSQCKYDEEMDRKSPTVPGLIILLTRRKWGPLLDVIRKFSVFWLSVAHVCAVPASGNEAKARRAVPELAECWCSLLRCP